MAKSFLVLGGAGYLGARIAELLLEFGHVTVTSRKLTPAKIAWAKLRGDRLTLHPFDSRNASISLESLLEGKSFDCVLNLATPSSGEASGDPQAARSGAIASLEAALHMLRDGAAKRLVHFSSFHVYGHPGQSAYRETDFPKPSHPYGAAHLACEERIRAHLDRERVVVFRPTNIIGSPAHPDLGWQERLFFLDCCRQAVNEGTIQLVNDGSAQRDFIPFADALSAVEKAVVSENFPARVFNLALGNARPLRDFVMQIAQAASRVAGREINVKFGEGRDPFDQPFKVDTSSLEATGWKAKGDLEQEIARTLSFYKRKGVAA